MRRFKLVDGEMVSDHEGEYCLYSDVAKADVVAADTLLTQLRGIIEQIEEWYA
jgi:endo-1,4-beta-mannosidase